MNANERRAKILKRQQQLTEALRATEAQILDRHSKDQVLARKMVGRTLLSLPTGDRDALLSMLLPHMSERNRNFLSAHLAGDQAPDLPPAPDVPHLN